MSLLGKNIIALVTVLAALTAEPLVAAAPEILCELSRPQIYLGESVVYRVTLNHVENPSPPALVGFDDFDVAPAGTQSLNQSMITVINGHRSEIIRRGRAYQYRLTPKRAGRLRVPGAVAQVDGQTLRGETLLLEVREPNSQDTVRMEITADPPSVYPTQRVTVTLSIFVRALPGEFSGSNPLSVQRTPPMLQIPWLESDQLTDGLTPVEDARVWLSQLRDLSGEGFGINDLRDNSVFSVFERRGLAFQPTPRRVTRTSASGAEEEYWLYEFPRSFVASRAGSYAFGPATLKGMFAVDVSRSGDLTGEHIYAVAPRVVVEVKDVPAAGRPASYLGAVGQFQWSAELTPTKCRVGDPITLVLTLRGRGSLDAAAAPDLSQVPGVAEHFKTYDGTRETKGNTCRFTYTLRPRSEKITQFPSIPGSYFDVASERYVTLNTEPIPIEVQQADALAEGQIVSSPGAAQAVGEPQLRRDGIFANVTDPSQFRDESVHAEYWLAGLGGLVGLYVLVASVTSYVRRRAADPAIRRRRAAVPRARRRLCDAITLLRARNTRDGAEAVRGALVGLVADVADATEAGMTSSDACRRLGDLGVERPLVDRMAAALATCDAARYAPRGAETNGLADEADELFDGVVRSLKKKRCLR